MRILASFILLLVASSSFFFLERHGKTSADARPNIVVILLDDLDKVVTEPYFDEVLPAMMRLKSEGVYFNAAFASTPLCCPSRASLLTGLYAHHTGVVHNAGPKGGFPAFERNQDDQKTAVLSLFKSGYTTGAYGKYLNGYTAENALPPVPPGWNYWHAFSRGPYYTGYNYDEMKMEPGMSTPILLAHKNAESDYSTDVVKKGALEFLSEQKAGHPFFLYLAPTAPHQPMEAAPRHKALAEKWKNNLPQRPNYFADGETIDDKPKWLRDSWQSFQSANIKDWVPVN